MKVKVFDLAYIHDTSRARPQPEEVILALRYNKPDEQLELWLYAVDKIAKQISPDAEYRVWYTFGHKTTMLAAGGHASIWYVHSKRDCYLIDAWFEFIDNPKLDLMFKLAWDPTPDLT